MKKNLLILVMFIMATFISTACAGGNTSNIPADSGDPEYEAMTIQIEGIRELDGAIAEITVAELRALPQYELSASFRRRTGLFEEHHMLGPLLSDVIAEFGGNLDDYEGLAMIGQDGYFFMFSREVINNTPNLMLAVVVNGEARLPEDLAPAWAGVQGQFGPYWVKQVARIVLYEEVPTKDITSIWVFGNLVEGIETINYEYFGSLDTAIEVGQILTRFDHVDSRSFFTMRATDGFMRDEAMSTVLSRYYIKIDGEDAPTNVNPYILLGMNVREIAWFSTNADAVVFPDMLLDFMELKSVQGEYGVPLIEVLYEVEVQNVSGGYFYLMGTAGERYQIAGSSLSGAILVPRPDGSAALLWLDGYDYPQIENLLRVRAK